MRPLRILVWHVHGSYLFYLTKGARHEFFLPTNAERSGDYSGKWGAIPWTDNVHDVPVDEVKHLELDAIVFQRHATFMEAQHAILSEEQRRLPKIYIEHDPPPQHPTDSVHPVDDPNVLMVHVTHFNRLMWNTRRTPSIVVEHGVEEHPEVTYTGALDRGIVSVNHLKRRGRRFGADVYEEAAREIPLDLIGMGSLELPGGIGEVLHMHIPSFIARYRFFFNPIRYTSLSLAVCEAMMCGMPIIGLATTEMPTVIQNGVTGFVDTDLGHVIYRMNELLAHPDLARQLGAAARAYAQDRFSLARFHRDWDAAFAMAAGHPTKSLRSRDTAHGAALSHY